MPFGFVATTSLNWLHILLRDQAAKQSKDSTPRVAAANDEVDQNVPIEIGVDDGDS
jgi:hypothetical protein